MARTKPEIVRLKARVDALSPWAHAIDLGDGVITPGNKTARRLSAIREMMDNLVYQGKDVLDLGTAEGLWLFEAEKRGAANCIGTDVRIADWEKFLLAKNERRSRAIHLPGCPVQHLPNRTRMTGLPHKYDIVQHLGLFQHLRDPLLSLAKSREVLRIDGILMLETHAVLGELPALMLWSGDTQKPRFGDPSITWAPTRTLLEETLRRSAFEPYLPEKWIEYGPRMTDMTEELAIGRICLLAKATDPASLHPLDQRKLRGDM